MEEQNFQDALMFSSVECALHTTDWEGFPIASHWHYFAEVIRVRSGSLAVTVENRVYTLSAGDTVFVLPLKRHALNHVNPDSPSTYDIIRLDMEQFGDLPSYSPDLRGMLLEGDKRGFPIMITAQEMHIPHMDLAIDAIMEEYRRRNYGYDLRIRALLFLLYTSLIQRWIVAGFVPQNYPSSIDPIYTLPNYIAHHIQKPLKV